MVTRDRIVKHRQHVVVRIVSLLSNESVAAHDLVCDELHFLLAKLMAEPGEVESHLRVPHILS